MSIGRKGGTFAVALLCPREKYEKAHSSIRYKKGYGRLYL